MKRISILLVALTALVLAACGSDEAASADPTGAAATAEPTAEPTPEPAESEAAEASDGASGSEVAIPSFDLGGIGGDPELAGRFPTTVAGESIEVQSFSGEWLAQMGGGDPAFEEFLASVDAELEDVSVAFGGNADGTIAVAAFKIPGASTAALEQEFLGATEEAGTAEDVERRTVGGKDVWAATSTEETVPGSVYIYVEGDTVYFLTAPDDEVAGEILEALP